MTRRAGMASSWKRTVRATVSRSMGPGSADGGSPADEVVGQHGALQPGGVGRKVARRAVLQPSSFFEVADGEFDAGVGPVEGVDLGGVAVEVGQEREVTPVGPQPSLAAVGQAGAAHDQSSPPVFGLGHLGLAAGGVGDLAPGRLVDAGDDLGHPLGVGAHGHRVANAVTGQTWRWCLWTRTPSRNASRSHRPLQPGATGPRPRR